MLAYDEWNLKMNRTSPLNATLLAAAYVGQEERDSHLTVLSLAHFTNIVSVVVSEVYYLLRG